MQLGNHVRGAAVDVKDEGSLSAFFKAADVLEVRFWGALRAIKQAEPFLAATGSVTLTSGIMSRRPRKGLFLAAAASGAIEHLVQGLAVELAPRRVNAVSLGFTLTEDHAGTMPEEHIKRATAAQLLNKAGKPEEVAQAYLYCMRGGYTTGQTIIADGGRILA